MEELLRGAAIAVRLWSVAGMPGLRKASRPTRAAMRWVPQVCTALADDLIETLQRAGPFVLAHFRDTDVDVQVRVD